LEELRIAAPKRVRRNDEIDASTVRVIGADGDQVGVLPLPEALELSSGQNMDLVEVSPNADPPVCRIMDYGKYVFEQNKKSQTAKRKQKQVQVKEVKFRPNTDEGDYRTRVTTR
jgi:translation initiation factor IF-3